MIRTSRLFIYLEQLGLDYDGVLRDAMRALVEGLMELDLSATIDAAHYERSEGRVTYRNGYRRRTWATANGDITLHIPKLRRGSYYPSFLAMDGLEHRIRETVQTALIFGVDPVALEELAADLNLPGGDISALIETVDRIVTRFHERALPDAYPVLWLDTLPVSDQYGRSSIAVVALGMHESGGTDVLAYQVTTGVEDPAFWRMFLRKLRKRGLESVELVTSDDHLGIKAAVERVLGSDWQYSRTHALRALLGYLPESEHERVTVAISTATTRDEFNRLAQSLAKRYSRASAFLVNHAADLAAHTLYPAYGQSAADLDVMLRVRQALEGGADAVSVFTVDDMIASPEAVVADWHIEYGYGQSLVRA